MISEQPPICKGCGEVILTLPVVQALNNDWHPKCFRCSSCGQRLNNWYFQNDGQLYCRKDYLVRFGDRCNGCTHIITGPLMTAGEHKYHPECFQCSRCQTLIGYGDSCALVERSFLYCEHCFKKGPSEPHLPQEQLSKAQTSPLTQTPRRKPHSIQMVEIPPTPEYHSHLKQQQHNHRHDDKVHHEQQNHKEGLPARKLQLSLQVASPDPSSSGWRSPTSSRHSFTLEGGRMTPCVQISELDSSTELHGLAVGDKILEVNGAAVRDKSLDEIRTLLTNYKGKVHVMLERDLSPLRIPPEEDSFASSSPARNIPSRNASSDDLNSTSASEGETVVVLDQPVKLRPKGSLRARAHSPSRRRSKSPSPCPSARQRSIDLSRSHSFSTRQQDHRAFRATDLLIGEVLGQGFFGQALKATHRVTGEQMVLKELHNFDEDAQKSFLREVSMLRSLSHPCVLKFLGVLYREKKLNLVTEFIDGGTLSDLLLDHSVDLSWKQRIAFAKDIAAGMSYLHSMNIIHRDLNSQNCLVRKDQSVVVADFGLAKIFPRREISQYSNISEKEKEGGSGSGSSSASSRKKKRFSRRKRGTVVGNPYWMAPEMMTKGVYDEKVDVFSYGIIVCETIARVTADPDYLPRSFDFGLNVEAFYQRFCQDVPEPYFMLGVMCSQIEPDQRPSFETVHVLCEALHLHVEHGMAVPADLQGSTVEFYRISKEKMYGQNYKDIDSCTQANTKTNVIPDSSRDVTSQTEVENTKDSLQNGDSGHNSSFISASDEGDSKSCSTSDEAINCIKVTEIESVTSHSVPDGSEKSNTEMETVTSHYVPDGSEKSNTEMEPVTSTIPDGSEKSNSGGCLLHSDCSKEIDNEKLTSGEVCALHIYPPSTVSTVEADVNKQQDLRISLDDGIGDSSVATTNEDYAYFSCSSESPSVSISSPCLSLEDFASCRSSPNSSENNLVNFHPDLESSEAPDINKDTLCQDTAVDATDSSNDRTDSVALPPGSLTSDQVLISSAFIVETFAQTGTSSTSDIALSVGIETDEDTHKHSNENGSTPCLSPRGYQTSLHLEYGAHVSPPPSSSHIFTTPSESLNEFDV